MLLILSILAATLITFGEFHEDNVTAQKPLIMIIDREEPAKQVVTNDDGIYLSEVISDE